MKKALPFFISLLFFLMPLVSAQQQKISVSEVEVEDYRDIGITEKGFEIKDPYALPIYEPRATSLLPFHEKISSLLNSYLGSLLSTFDLKEAFALRILFQDIEPLLSFLGDLISLPITCIALPFLSFVRLLKAPLDILEFLITAILDTVFSIPADEIAIIEHFSSALKDLFHIPSLLLKPIELLVYSPDPLAALVSISFSGSLHSFLSPLSTIGSEICRVIDFIPALNVVKGSFTAYLLPFFRSMIDPLVSAVGYLISPYRGALNILLLPSSLLFTALNSLCSMMKTLVSFFVLPILFLLRIPLTPVLILFNLFKHSLQGFGQFLRSLSVIMPLLPAFLALLLLLSFLPSVAVSSLASLAILLISLASSAVLGIALSALLSLAAFVLVLFGGVALSMITAGGSAIAGIALGALAGLIVGAVAGFLVGGIAGAIAGAIVGLLAGAVLGVVAGVIAGIILLIIGAIAAIVVGGAAVVLGIVSILIEVVICLLLGIPTGGAIYTIEALFGAIGVVLIAAGIIGGILGFLLIAALALLTGAAIIVIGAIPGLAIGAVGGLILGAIAGILVGGIIGLVAGALAGLVIGIATGLLAGALMLLLTVPFAVIFAFISGLAGLLIGALPAALITAAGSLISLTMLPVLTLPLSAILFVLFLGASLVIISAFALLSILSPELFKVVFPPEIIEIAKRLALLPKDIARIINGLSHLPVDTMRAIAVLDAPAEIEEPEVTSGEVITYGEQQEMIMERNETVTEELPEEGEPQNETVEETVPPEEPAPPPEEPITPEEPVPEIPPELSEEHNISTVIGEGKEFFIEQVNATGGIVKETFTDPVLMSGGESASAYKGLMDYGMDTIKRFQNLTESLGKQASYGTYANAYNKSVMGMNNFGMWNNTYTGDLARDLEDYRKDRENLDRMLQEAAADGVITQGEAEELRKETDRVRNKGHTIYEGVGDARDALNRGATAYFIRPYYGGEPTDEALNDLVGEDGHGGLSQELIDYLSKDYDYLSERYKNLGGV